MRKRNVRLATRHVVGKRPPSPKAGVSASAPDLPPLEEPYEPLTETVQVTIDGDEEVAESAADFASQFDTLFDEQGFLKLWEEEGREAFADVQHILVQHYAFLDLVLTIENGIRVNVDRQMVLSEDKFFDELGAMTTLKLTLAYARLQFDDDEDYAAVRSYLLTPEVTAPAVRRAAGNNASHQIKQLYELMYEKQGQIERTVRKQKQSSEAHPPGMTMSTSRPSRTTRQRKSK